MYVDLWVDPGIHVCGEGVGSHVRRTVGGVYGGLVERYMYVWEGCLGGVWETCLGACLGAMSRDPREPCTQERAIEVHVCRSD